MMFRLWSLFRSIFFRARLEREMQEEMALHLRRTIVRLQAAGMSADDARAAARPEFGNIDVIKEEARDVWAGEAWSRSSQISAMESDACRARRSLPSR